jgi:hypothetical protein
MTDRAPPHDYHCEVTDKVIELTVRLPIRAVRMEEGSEEGEREGESGEDESVRPDIRHCPARRAQA